LCDATSGSKFVSLLKGLLPAQIQLHSDSLSAIQLTYIIACRKMLWSFYLLIVKTRRNNMKANFANKINRVSRILAVAAAAVVIIAANPMTTLANGGGKSAKHTARTSGEDQVSVKFMGSTDRDVTFKVDFENPTGEKFALIVKNDNGDIVFNQQYTDTHFSKTVIIENTESDIQPTFIIRTNNQDIVRQFQVSTTLTQLITVTRL
jgi:hypothetical protein